MRGYGDVIFCSCVTLRAIVWVTRREGKGSVRHGRARGEGVESGVPVDKSWRGPPGKHGQAKVRFSLLLAIMDYEKSDTQRHEYVAPAANPSPGRYAATRLSTLKPARDQVPNPITLLRMLNLQQWLFFLVAFFAWTWDAFDFFTVSLTVTDLAKTFDKTKADITWGITLVLMLRSVGSIIFGLAADRYGRKWPFIVNNILFIVLELGTGFCQTYEQFLGVRALFGIAMGGLYGNAAATGKPHILLDRLF